MNILEELELDNFILTVTREEIEKQDTENIKEIFSKLIKADNGVLRQMMMKYSLVVSGYDNDARELFEIPEFINWVQKLLDVVIPGFMFYFENTTMKLLTLAYLKAKKVQNGQVYIDPFILSEFCKDRLQEAKAFMKDLDYGEEDCEKFKDEILNSFGLHIIHD
jgi:hypothetical protein